MLGSLSFCKRLHLKSLSSLNHQLTASTHPLMLIAIQKTKWENLQCLGNRATCRENEQTAAAATTKAEKCFSLSQQVLRVKKTCHLWNIDVILRSLARGCCADVEPSLCFSVTAVAQLCRRWRALRGRYATCTHRYLYIKARCLICCWPTESNLLTGSHLATVTSFKVK